MVCPIVPQEKKESHHFNFQCLFNIFSFPLCLILEGWMGDGIIEERWIVKELIYTGMFELDGVLVL